MRYKIEYGLIGLFILLMRLLPIRMGVWVGSLIGSLYYAIDRKHRLLAMGHLQQALGHQKDANTIQRIVREVYRNMGRLLAESVYLPSRTSSQVRAWAPIMGLEHYSEAAKQGKGIIILTAHFGNWEIIPKAFWAHGLRIHAVVRPLDNPYLDRIVQGWRAQNGMGVLNKWTDVHQIMKLLRTGETVAFLLDQNTAEEDAVFVDFFGRPAATHKGVAILTLRSQAPVLPVFVRREGAKHHIMIEKPLDLPRAGSQNDKIVAITALFTKTIESYVARYPEQWLWMHRRWKTQQTKCTRS